MKNIKNMITPRLLGAAIAAAALITPGFASAQDAMAYNSDANQQIQGTVAAINGTWNITVADANGYADSVALHQGTIINPTGLTLEPGMQVTIDGYADGPNFDALEIDTPYQYQGPAPTAVYYGPGAWYPGYATGWGPSFSLFFDFNSRRYEQRSFAFGGQVRRPEAPPSGWENRPHGYIGRTGNAPSYGNYRTAYSAPQQQRNYPGQPQQQRYYGAPPQQQRTFNAPPQQQRNFAPPPQQQRSFNAPPQQQGNFAPQQQRTFNAPPQQQGNFAPQQQRTFNAPPQQQRNFAPPPQQARSFAAPPQQQRTFAAPPQQQRNFAPPPQQARGSAPGPRGPQDVGSLHHGG
jgi:hypothetical protein